MKNFKFLFLLSLGLFLSVGSLQAQAKKCCSLPCSKAKTAQVNTSQEATPAMAVSQASTTQEVKKVKGCNPKNCNPKNCTVKDCPPGCDISQCIKGSKTSSTGLLKVADSPQPSKVRTKQVALN